MTWNLPNLGIALALVSGALVLPAAASGTLMGTLDAQVGDGDLGDLDVDLDLGSAGGEGSDVVGTVGDDLGLDLGSAANDANDAVGALDDDMDLDLGLATDATADAVSGVTGGTGVTSNMDAIHDGEDLRVDVPFQAQLTEDIGVGCDVLNLEATDDLSRFHDNVHCVATTEDQRVGVFHGDTVWPADAEVLSFTDANVETDKAAQDGNEVNLDNNIHEDLLG